MNAAAPAAVAMPLAFRIGARTLWSLRRRMIRVPLTLADALTGSVPALPPLGDGEGWSITSLPVGRLGELDGDGLLAFVRQRYTRYYVDLMAGFDAWWAGLSGNQRSGLKRKAKRLGARAEIRRYRTPEEFDAFYALARRVSATTYQERLLDAGLPETAEFRTRMLAAAAGGNAYGWLLLIDGEPAAYLYCPAAGDSVIYEYLGHDPRFADLSPGAVLQLEALRDLFAEGRRTHFDFTEGEGQHKRGMASGGIPCVDILLLRPTLANLALIGALRGFDGSIAMTKALVRRLGLESLAKKVRRG